MPRHRAIPRIAVARIVTTLLATVAVPAVYAQGPSIPNGEWAIAYRQLQDGKLSQAVFQTYLRCSDGECTLLTLTLNQCIVADAARTVFYPKIQQWSTNGGWNGYMSVARPAPDVLLAAYQLDGAVFRMRFTFRTVAHPSINGGKPFPAEIKEFSGGVVKDSAISGKIITWELVPLTLKDANSFKLDCSVLLDGIVP